MLIGNVGKEPVVRYYDHDQAVATFPLATTERGYTLPNGTQVPDRTDWHNVVLSRDWPRLSKSMSIREINFILRVVYIIVLMTMQKDLDIT